MKAAELAKRLKSQSCPVILDVRSNLEYRRGHIPGALHLPFLKAAAAGELLPQDRQAEIVITCEHGPRAQLAMGLLKLRGYRQLCLLQGHMQGWRRAGLPIE